MQDPETTPFVRIPSELFVQEPDWEEVLRATQHDLASATLIIDERRTIKSSRLESDADMSAESPSPSAPAHASWYCDSRGGARRSRSSNFSRPSLTCMQGGTTCEAYRFVDAAVFGSRRYDADPLSHIPGTP